jgi:hypothetical protein
MSFFFPRTEAAPQPTNHAARFCMCLVVWCALLCKEMALDFEIKRLYAVAASPELYPILVELGTVSIGRFRSKVFLKL